MVLMVKVSIATLVLLWFWQPLVGEPTPPAVVKIEFRRAETAAREGLTEATVGGMKIYLHKSAEIANEDIADARATVDGKGAPEVEITFTKEGQKKVEKMTDQHMDKPLAILIDGKVVAAPTIRARISTSAVITGTFTKKEADRIASGISSPLKKCLTGVLFLAEFCPPPAPEPLAHPYAPP